MVIPVYPHRQQPVNHPRPGKKLGGPPPVRTRPPHGKAAPAKAAAAPHVEPAALADRNPAAGLPQTITLPQT